ncbi:MAG: hypothetical protein U0U67_09950 [Chitinophagales bacterium]
MKKHFYLLFSISVLFTSCSFFNKETPDDIPAEVSEDVLQAQRYAYKKDLLKKEKSLFDAKSEQVEVKIHNVITYNIIDDANANIGDGFIYYIVDLSVDNFSNTPFDIQKFTSSCHLTNEDPKFAYANVAYILKMYSLQTDSLETDVNYLKNFLSDEMPPKQIYRGKVFAYEVSKQDKNALFFHFTINGKEFVYKVKDKDYSASAETNDELVALPK